MDVPHATCLMLCRLWYARDVIALRGVLLDFAGLLFLALVLAQGTAAIVITLIGSDASEINPDVVRTDPSQPFRYVDRPYE